MRGGSATPQPQGTHAGGGPGCAEPPSPHHGTRREPRGCGAPLQFPPVASKLPNLSVLIFFIFQVWVFCFRFCLPRWFCFLFLWGIFVIFSVLGGAFIVLGFFWFFFFVVVFFIISSKGPAERWAFY